jgi:hypothetical protein
MEGPGLFINFALVLASVQWYLPCSYLPKAWLWFIETVAGILLSAFAVWLLLGGFSVQNWDPLLIMAVVMLLVGLVLGFARWLYFRRFLPNAFWIISIDVLAAGSVSGGKQPAAGGSAHPRSPARSEPI